MVVTSFFLDRWFRNKFSAYRRYLNKHHKLYYSSSLSTTVLLVAVMYLGVAVQLEARYNFKEVLSSENSAFNLHFTDPTRIGDETSKQMSGVQVIANLSKHLWVFDTAEKQVYMLPHDSVVVLEALVEVAEEGVSDE